MSQGISVFGERKRFKVVKRLSHFPFTCMQNNETSTVARNFVLSNRIETGNVGNLFI